MNVRTIATPQLGDRSYLITNGTIGVVVDPQRDIDRILTHLENDDITVVAVFETHLHNDYVSGGLELSQRLGARYIVGGGDEASYPCESPRDGEAFLFDGLTVVAKHTPGHTVGHVSYLVSAGEESVLCTGGSMLFGTVGRTDLVGPEYTERLTSSQYHSVRRLAAEVDKEARVLPTHGFGSFCSSASTSGATESTVGVERQYNIACVTETEEEFAKVLLGGLATYPTYYAHMGLLNRAGVATPFHLERPPLISPEELGARIGRGEWVVDLRARRRFADSHVAGTLNLELGTGFSTYLGWILPWGMPVTLIASTESEVMHAVRDLSRIGIDRVAGAIYWDVVEESTLPTSSYEVARFEDLSSIGLNSVKVLDVRRHDEWRAGHLRDATHIPLHELNDRALELDDVPVWIHCASGFRASVASSILDRLGKKVVYLDDDWTNAAEFDLPVIM
jgi:glyoxylase-like metal-dependent hydrolase (beta-lactamase superfamily II)/rhodanese-related sulfurtransferase